LFVPKINVFYVSPGTFITDAKRSVKSRLNLYKPQYSITKVGDQLLLGHDVTQAEFSAALDRGSPFAAGRLGTVEGDIVSWKIQNPNKRFPEALLRNAKTLAGNYPATQSVTYEFAERYLNAASQLDFLGLRNHYFFGGYFDMETSVVQKAKPTNICSIDELSPLGEPDSWVQHLAERKVLVIHPFSKTIEHQYRHNRMRVFQNKNWLPQFYLQLYKPFQTSGEGVSPEIPSSWDSALNMMLDEISKLEFDIALISAGGYGLPLAAGLKQSGKIAIHVGGVLQLFFGIRGGRWDSVASQYGSLSLYHTDSWVRPLKEETPDWSKSIEGGAYW
jgi:hypothetical protein